MLMFKLTVQKDKIRNLAEDLQYGPQLEVISKILSKVVIQPNISLVLFSWKFLMATDFMDVAAHSVEVVRCTKASFRTLTGKNSFSILCYFPKLLCTSLFFDKTKSKECYLISIYATKFSCLDKHLSFSVNLQKSQFVGIVESRAGNVLYPIAEDIPETKNVTIYN